MQTEEQRLINHRTALRKWRKNHPERNKELGKKYDAIRNKTEKRRLSHRESQRLRQQRYRKIPIVYVWMTPDGLADYVGRGSRNRALQHKYKSLKSPWWTPNHVLLSMTCENEWQAMEYEGKWGQFYQPRFNKEGYRHG